MLQAGGCSRVMPSHSYFLLMSLDARIARRVWLWVVCLVVLRCSVLCEFTRAVTSPSLWQSPCDAGQRGLPQVNGNRDKENEENKATLPCGLPALLLSPTLRLRGGKEKGKRGLVQVSKRKRQQDKVRAREGSLKGEMEVRFKEHNLQFSQIFNPPNVMCEHVHISMYVCTHTLLIHV